MGPCRSRRRRHECDERTELSKERNRRNELIRKGEFQFWGLCRVGDRRAARTLVSCLPSSNRTCGFPASGSPIIFFQRRAPEPFQMTHPPYHAIQPTAFMKDMVVPPSSSRAPGTLMLTPEPQQQLAPNRPVHLVKRPVAVADPKVRTPPIQNRVQLPDHRSDHLVTWKRSHHLTHPLPNIAARLRARPHQRHSAKGFPKLEAQKREPSSSDGRDQAIGWHRSGPAPRWP
jgi:hypothetical protein